MHRADTYLQRKANLARWLYTAERGGVLISPFISRDEHDVRHQAEAIGARLVVLQTRPLRDREKPSGRDFELCIQGRLLLISPVNELPDSHETFMFLNATAKALCGATVNPINAGKID